LTVKFETFTLTWSISGTALDLALPARRMPDLLEGYTYDEPWPQEITRFELRYDRGEARDLHRLRTLLHSF
jgi:hypothetical protein